MTETYTKLTQYLGYLENNDFGEWIIDRDNEGSEEHPIQIPFVSYNEMVRGLSNDIYVFHEEHPEYGLDDYRGVMEKAHIEYSYSAETMGAIDVSKMDGNKVMAMLMGAIRAERFCDGTLLEFLQEGVIKKWLERLKEIDKN